MTKAHAVPTLLFFAAMNAAAQAPAPPAVPADVTPLYVVTYIEAKPTARDETAALLKSYQAASRKTAGNLRSIVVQRPRRPGQFVVVAAWKDKAAWDAHMAAPATKEFRDKLAGVRNAPADDRFHNSLSVGPMEDASGTVYGVTHVDVIPPQKDNAIVALKALGDANRAAAGNVRFEIVQQTNRPNHFTVFEVWRSREAFDANTMSAHQREFRDKLSGMAGALYDERLYEILN
ncbi:MAG TPA: antibiotic biosynthesis monooxygenase [Burkholderiales bacterium]|jgi:quinol monooxygenase YgiN|nr:antibiotic biosynthesis monooxygenase [Burkholderiales bacterium]